mgnify:CR=1 FL=1
MVHAEDVVRKVIDVDSQDYYHVLCLAITVAHEALPEQLTVKKLAERVRAISDKGPTAVPKALSRAAIDIWENGDREALGAIYGRKLRDSEKITPRLLVFKMAKFMDKSPTYSVWRDALGRAYGIVATCSVNGNCLTVVPVQPDVFELEAFAQFLNECQAPLESFQKLMDSKMPTAPATMAP